MPEIYVHLAEGRTPEQKRALLQNLTKTMVDTLSVPPDAVVVTLIESPKHLKAKGGIPFDER